MVMELMTRECLCYTFNTFVFFFRYGDDNSDVILYTPSGCMSNDLTVLQCYHTALGSCSNDSELTVQCCK